jgi:hypothetical protein
MLTTCKCGFDSAEFISRHDIADGARFECPVCGAEREARLPEPGSHEVGGESNGSLIAGETQKHLPHDLR